MNDLVGMLNILSKKGRLLGFRGLDSRFRNVVVKQNGR